MANQRTRLVTLALALTLVGRVTLLQAQVRTLKGAEIERELSGRVAVGSENGRRTEQLFLAGGATFYSVDGAQTQGLWEVRGDQYCSRWPPGTTWVCYAVVREGSSTRFVAGSGRVYSVQLGP